MISQQNGLAEKLKRIVVANQYVSVSFSLSTPCFINRWLISSAVCKRNNDLNADVRCDLDGKVAVGSELESLQDSEVEGSWRYYMSDDIISFYKRNSPEKMFPLPISNSDEKYIYALSCVIADADESYLIHISTMMPMPLRMWINGELVFADTIAYIQKNHIFSYHFKKGINTILIEKPMCAWNRRLHMTPKFFSVSIRKMKTVLESIFAKEIQEESLLNKYLDGYTIVSNKLFYDRDEQIKVIVFSNKSINEKITVSVSTASHENIFELVSICGVEMSIPAEHPLSGIIKITVNRQSSYLFVGNYSDYQNRIKESVSLVDNRVIDTYSMLFNIDILDSEKGLVKNSIEPIHTYYSQDVFRKIFAFDKFFSSNLKSDELRSGFIALESPVDSALFACYIELPNEYKDGVNYPLVVYLNFDDSLTRIPTNPHRILKENDTESISLTLCGRGDFIKDYINSYEIMWAIKEVSKRYSVDVKRISLFGICTGGRRGFELVNKYVGVFSSMFSFASTSVNDRQAADNLPIIQLCDIDDMFYNGATVINRLEIEAEKFYIVSNFEHEELIDYYCNARTAEQLLSYQNEVPKDIDISYGIKGIYLSPCSVLKPNLENNEIESKLLLLLTKPVVSRARNYNVPVITSIDEGYANRSNMIFVIDQNKIDEYPLILASKVKSLNLKLKNKNKSYIFITDNPYVLGKEAVFIMYSDIMALNEIMNLWINFESNILFDKDLIIINDKEGLLNA